MKTLLNIVVLLTVLAFPAFADEARPHRLTPVPIPQVIIQDDFWSPKLKVWREVTIPDCLTKFENDRGGAINNFDRIRDGKTGGHAGPEWYDGLIYEMIRGSADFLAAGRDAVLEKRLDGYIRAHRRSSSQGPERIPEHLDSIDGAAKTLGPQRR